MGDASALYVCMEGEWATKRTNAACALEVLLTASDAMSTCSPSCFLGFVYTGRRMEGMSGFPRCSVTFGR